VSLPAPYYPEIDLPPAIEAIALTKTYQPAAGPLTIFRDLSFSIAPGERVALIGASGAGKSTLLHLLGGLDHATSGQILLHQQDLTQLSPDQLADFRNSHIGFVWQIQSLLPEFTAQENVAMPLLIRGERNPLPRAATALDEVGLAHRLTHRAGELSGGEQQRVALARALVTRPRFLFADEPTGNLDATTGDRIIDLLTDLHSRHGLTSVYVTHNLDFARRCDRILELARGQLHPT
jgi:lipoprotein-releasing system ATP-binding protein